MAEVDQQQGGPSTSRRRKQAGKSKAQHANDWSRTGEGRSRASPRWKRHGDIDMDIVESSDDANDANDAKASPKKHRRRRRPQPLSSTASDTASDATPPAKTPQPSPKGARSKSMRVPNASVPVLDTAPAHRRPTCIIEEVDDEDAAPSGPSRPVSRQTIARRDTSPRSAHRYRSTPESRRSPRTSVSDSEDDTDATSDSDSDSEQVILRHRKHLPPAPMAPPVPSAPPAPAIHSSLQERLSRQPEMVYEEEGDGTSRYAPSMARARSLSRPPSSRQDPYRRPRDITVSGPPSLDETRARSRSRSKSARPSRRNYESDVYISSRPASSFRRPHAASSYSLSSSAKRSAFLGEFTAPSVRPSHAEKQTLQPLERTTMCAHCRNPAIPVSQTVKLRCCHRMCHSCLRKAFRDSITDPQRMPPTCCNSDFIPTEYVKGFFDAGFKRDWNQKYAEHGNRSLIFCPSRRCGALIRPQDMHHEAGRVFAKCAHCKTKVCGSCSGRWHHQPECPRDDETTHFVERARRESWQRCHCCKSVLEIKDGRNHMICRCGAEFCLVCRGKWKTCNCPWFKYDPLEADALDSRHNPFASRPTSPRDYRSDFGPLPAAPVRPRPASYEDDPYLRRVHERQREEHLTRRMHSFDAFGQHVGHAEYDRNRTEYDFDEPRDPRDRRRREVLEGYDAPPFMDDDYHRRAATVVAPSPPQVHLPAAPPPPHSAFEPPSRPTFDRAASGFDYSSAVQRSRGMRHASPERYDDYMTQSYTPERRRARSPEPWNPFSQERRPRSRDRRHTFPSESRPTSPESWQQMPTRYPSPEPVPVPVPEERRRGPSPERRRAPSPERRRTTSLERRLADRFKPESRQSPAVPSVPVGAIGTIGSLGPVGPLSPTRPPPAPSRAATHIGTSMPMAPVPPPAPHGPPPQIASLRRHHTMDEDIYSPGPGMHGGGIPPADWFGPPPSHAHPMAHPVSHPAPPGMGMGPLGMPMGMMPHHPHGHPHSMPTTMPMHHPTMQDMLESGNNINAGSPRAPNVRRRPPQATREHNKHEPPKSSVLAGLGGMGRGMHRVSEWVNYVEPGLPEDTATVVQ
ncbi:hypothetical protein VTI74DRAFT_4917 [Chaetomium olivicolor]